MQQAINRAFDILEYIGTDPETPSSFSEIATNVGLNTGTCANIINAMVKRGYLEKLEGKKGYLLGKKIYELTSFDGYNKELVKVAKPILEKLTEKVNENASLAVLKGNSRIVLFQTQSKQDIQAISAIDKPAYDSSTGRLLIAMLSDDELNRYISLYGLPTASIWKEATTKKKFAEAIEQIRMEGYAIQESEKHIAGISVTVRQNNKVIAALCVFLPTFRLAAMDKQLLIEELRKASEQIAGLLKK